MNVYESGSKLVIEAGPATKDTLVYLGVGGAFCGVGLWLVAHGSPVGWLFAGLGLLALVHFVRQGHRTARVYVFDQATQQLHLSEGRQVPFAEIDALVHEDTWRGTYGERHRDHAVKLSTTRGTFLLPANSPQEATLTAEHIRAWIWRSVGR